MALSPDGKQVASTDRRGRIEISGVALDGGRTSLPSPEAPIWSLAFTRDGTGLLIGQDEAARLVDIRTGEVRARLAPQSGEVTRAALDPSGRRIAIATTSGQVLVQDIAGETSPLTLDVTPNVVWSVSFSADGETLATADSDEVVSIWSLPAGTRKARFSGHVQGATDVVLLGDGATVAASDRDGSLHF